MITIKTKHILVMVMTISLLTFSSTSILAQAPVKVSRFDFAGHIYLEDKINHRLATIFRPQDHAVVRINGYDNRPEAIRLYSDGPSVKHGRIDLPPETAQYLAPDADGYTIACWVQPYIGSYIKPAGNQVFWAATSDGTVYTGFKQMKHMIAMDRIVDWLVPVREWTLQTWRPDMFDAAGGWHKVFISVYRDRTYIKTYYPGETEATGGWLVNGTGGHTELLYMGSQDISAVTNLGFGWYDYAAAEKSGSIQALDDFDIYDRAMTYHEMDVIYTAELANVWPHPAGREADTETITAVEEKARETNVVVYPNPAKNGFTIEVAGNEDQPVEATLYSPIGVAVGFATFTGSYTMNIQSLAKGLYVLKINGKTIKTAHKIIKE